MEILLILLILLGMASFIILLYGLYSEDEFYGYTFLILTFIILIVGIGSLIWR